MNTYEISFINGDNPITLDAKDYEAACGFVTFFVGESLNLHPIASYSAYAVATVILVGQNYRKEG